MERGRRKRSGKREENGGKREAGSYRVWVRGVRQLLVRCMLIGEQVLGLEAGG